MDVQMGYFLVMQRRSRGGEIQTYDTTNLENDQTTPTTGDGVAPHPRRSSALFARGETNL
jgi:hypothetical protein